MARDTRSPWLATSLAVGLATAVAVGLVAGRPTAADEPARPHHIVYLHVSGEGPQAKAWYDGGPPSGTSVQAALNTFANQGYRFAAVSSSGTGASQVVSTGGTAPAQTDPSALEPFFVVLLER